MMTPTKLVEMAYSGEVLAQPGNRGNTIHRLGVILAHKNCSSAEAVWEQVKVAVEKTYPERGEATFFAAFNRTRRSSEIDAVADRVIGSGGLMFRISGHAGSGKSSNARRLLASLDEGRFPVVVIDGGPGRLYRSNIGAAGEEVGLDNRDDYYAAKTLIVVMENG